MKSDIVFGAHAVLSVFECSPKRILKIYIQYGRTNKMVNALVYQAKRKNVPVIFVERHFLDTKANGVHQGIMAVVSVAQTHTEKDLDALLDHLNEPPFLLILDCITDPHNLGACVRSADAAGIHAVIIPKDKSAKLNATAAKVASGAADNTPIVQVTNMARSIRQLKQRGIWITGTADNSRHTLYQSELTGPRALIMGSEDKGMRRLTKELCDSLIRIPMAGSVSSLNVSVATGVCLFEAIRQRRYAFSQSNGSPI